MKLKNIFYLSILLTFIYSKDNSSVQKIPYSVWDSDSSNIGPAEIWFQDWVDYTRLFIKSVDDTVEIDKHPYSKTDFKKTYMNDKVIAKPTYVQMLGNITWEKKQNWKNGVLNKFKWHVDRDQNWKYTNTSLSGTAKIENKKLYLRIFDYDKLIIDTKSRIRKYK